MTQELERLASLVLNYFKYNCIYLTGNTQEHISIIKVEDNRITIAIDPPDYDLDLYKKKRIVQYLNNGESYANETNQKGTVFRPNKTKYWANTNCVEICNIFASEIGAKLKNKLPTNEEW